jgi:hypothetical protein
MDPVSQHFPVPPDHRQPETPLAQLVGRLSQDLQLLARREAQLAKHEIGVSLERMKQPVAKLVISGAALVAGLLTLVAAAVAGLATALPVWAAATLVGAGVSLLGAVLFLNARAQLARVSFVPEQALRGVQSDVTAIKGAAT